MEEKTDVIEIKKKYVDLTGDLIAGILLSRIAYLLSSENTNKVVEKEGKKWLAMRRADWKEDCRLSTTQVDRGINLLERKGLIEKKTFKYNGTPIMHVRLLKEV